MWFPLALASTALWAAVNVTDSIIVRRFLKDPVVIYFFICLIRLPLLLGISWFVDVRTEWAVPMLLLGVPWYVGLFLYTYLIDRIDASVVNAAWSIQAIFLSIVGFVLFSERWTLLQTFAALLLIGSVFFLSSWHKHISALRTVLLLSLLALIFVPQYSVQKAALLAGADPRALFFWQFLGSAIVGILFPLLFRRSHVSRKSLRTIAPAYFLFAFFDAVLALAGGYVELLALDNGPLSLVSVISNTQPFFILLIAAAVSFTIPSLAPRELLTAQSLTVKFIGFLGLTAGLILLAYG